MTGLSWLLIMVWIIHLTLVRSPHHTSWAQQSPTSIPTPTPYATFTADSTMIVKGTCTWLRWNVGNAQSVLVEGEPKPLSGFMLICPTVSTMYRLQLFTAEGEQERLLKITVIPPTPIPAFTPTPSPAPFPTFTPLQTSMVIPTPTPTPIWVTPSEQFPPPSLMEPVMPIPTELVTPVPTASVVEQPALPLATIEAAIEAPTPSPTIVAERLSEERSVLEPPQESARREPTKRMPPSPIEGTRQDVMRLLVFGLVGIASAAILGLISLILWWRRL